TGQKSTKHKKDSDGEPDPTPRKSPKRSGQRSSASGQRSPSSEGHDRPISPSRHDGEERQVILESRVEARSHSALSTSPKHTDEPMDYDQKENIGDMSVRMSGTKTPTKVSGKDSDKEPFTPRSINQLNAPQATSTPAPNGIISTGHALSVSVDSDQDQTDQSDDEAFTPSDQQDSYDRNPAVDYGKFYNTSYLVGAKSTYLQKASVKPIKKVHSSPHFHRPVNFSYSREPPEFLKSKKTTGTKVIVRRTRRASSPSDLKNEEAIRMSMFPGGKPPKPNEITKIEQEDWPGPPSLAAILPEIIRARRKSKGEEDDDDDEDMTPTQDEHLIKEIQEISKFKDKSGIGKIIYKELEAKKAQPPKPLNPWKASRVPSAKFEPRYSTRYQSPMFASPSRFLDRPRRSWDDSDIQRGYRTMSTMANYPVPRPGYGSYGLTPRAATLPLSGLFGGPLTYRFYDFDETDIAHRPASAQLFDITLVPYYTLQHESHTTSSILGGQGMSILSLQRSTWHTEAEPQVYPYDRLKITNFDLPKDVDRNMLEIHLSPEEFSDIFKMGKEEFYKIAEWRRNDIKRKADLF
ncbi:hypothetical protein FSP39_014527, partial [Pinctada imbricata]